MCGNHNAGHVSVLFSCENGTEEKAAPCKEAKAEVCCEGIEFLEYSVLKMQKRRRDYYAGSFIVSAVCSGSGLYCQMVNPLAWSLQEGVSEVPIKAYHYCRVYILCQCDGGGLLPSSGTG